MVSEAITNRSEHDAVVQRAEEGSLVVVMIYADSNPACRMTIPGFEKMSEDHGTNASFYKMELNATTSAMWKLSVQNTPSFLIMKEAWAQTIVGPNLRMVEEVIKERSQAV